MAFFGLLLFRSAAFVFRHWLSVFCLRASVFVHMGIYAHVQARRQRWRWEGTGRCAHFPLFTHGNASLTFMFFFYLASLLLFSGKQLVGTEWPFFSVTMLHMHTNSYSSLRYLSNYISHYQSTFSYGKIQKICNSSEYN